MTTFFRPRRCVVWGLLATALCAAVPEEALALPPYIRIEEDWELVLNTPDLSFPTPQIAVSMKPSAASTKTCLFLVNHHDTPAFQAGGGQIQLWEGDLKSYKSFSGPILQTVGERVTWTQYMQRDGAHIQFGLSAVSGDAWGDNTAETLGGPIYWKDGNPEFWNYDSAVSVDQATITFGPERIELLKLVEVRKYMKDGTFDVEGSRQVYPIQ